MVWTSCAASSARTTSRSLRWEQPATSAKAKVPWPFQVTIQPATSWWLVLGAWEPMLIALGATPSRKHSHCCWFRCFYSTPRQYRKITFNLWSINFRRFATEAPWITGLQSILPDMRAMMQCHFFLRVAVYGRIQEAVDCFRLFCCFSVKAWVQRLKGWCTGWDLAGLSVALSPKIH